MHPEALTNEGKKLFPVLKNLAGFYLAGGTAFALQLGHRLSVDFDFFSSKELPDSLLPLVEKIFSNHLVTARVNNKDELTVFINNIKITFLSYPFPVLRGYIEYEGLTMLTVSELAATKAYTVGRRGSFKDYIDLYFAIEDKKVTLAEIIELAQKKYGAVFNGRLFLEQLVYLEDVADVEIVFLREEVNRGRLERFFAEEVRRFKL